MWLLLGPIFAVVYFLLNLLFIFLLIYYLLNEIFSSSNCLPPYGKTINDELEGMCKEATLACLKTLSLN